jgi:hypothetical protein
MLIPPFSTLKLAGQFVKLFYDLLVVDLNVLAGEFIYSLFYFFAGHTDRKSNGDMLTECEGRQSVKNRNETLTAQGEPKPGSISAPIP